MLCWRTMLIALLLSCVPDIIFQETYDYRGQYLGDAIYAHDGKLITIVGDAPGSVTVKKGEESQRFAVPGEGRLQNTRISLDDTRVLIQGQHHAYELDLTQHSVTERDLGDYAYGASGALVFQSVDRWDAAAYTISGATGPTFAEACNALHQTATGDVIAECNQHVRFLLAEQHVLVQPSLLAMSPSGTRAFVATDSDIYVLDGATSSRVLPVSNVWMLAPVSDTEVIGQDNDGVFRLQDSGNGWTKRALQGGFFATQPPDEHMNDKGFLRISADAVERFGTRSCGTHSYEQTYRVRYLGCTETMCTETDGPEMGMVTVTGIYTQDNNYGCAGAGMPWWWLVISLLRRRSSRAAL